MDGAVFKTSAPIEIDVKTVKPTLPPGLHAACDHDGAGRRGDFNRKERATAPERKTFTWMVNYCRDGSLPNEEPK